MRTRLSPDRGQPLRFISTVSAYAALVALVIALFTTSGAAATIAAILMAVLLVGSYLLERWARRRLLYTAAADTPARDGRSSEPDAERLRGPGRQHRHTLEVRA
jgi:hypothetical protein